MCPCDADLSVNKSTIAMKACHAQLSNSSLDDELRPALLKSRTYALRNESNFIRSGRCSGENMELYEGWKTQSHAISTE